MPPLSPPDSGVRSSKLTLLAPPTARDSAGGTSGSFTSAGDIWGWAIALTGRETFREGQYAPEVNYRITVRYQDVKTIYENRTIADYWLQRGNEYFDIQAAITRDQKNQWVDLLCVEKAGVTPRAN